MSWLQLRAEIAADFAEHSQREHEVRMWVEWIGAHKQAKSTERNRQWRWRQGQEGRRANSARCGQYYRQRKAADAAWCKARSAAQAARIAAAKRCPVKLATLLGRCRASSKRRWAKTKADAGRRAQKVAALRAWRAAHRQQVNAAARARNRAIAADPVLSERRRVTGQAWRDANREHVRQYQRDRRARVKAQQQREAA